MTKIIFPLVLLLAMLIFQHGTINRLEKDNSNLKDTIALLKEESVIAQNRYLEAQEDAAEDMKKAAIANRNLLKTKIPLRCEDAVKWSIEQAKKFSNDTNIS